MFTFVIFIIILSILVLVHEFGHFYAAKKAGVRVEEFGFGLSPRVFGKRIGETVYSFNLLPFGGFVKLEGEDELTSTGNEVVEKTESSTSFASKSAFSRTLIIIAGVFMNVIFGVFLYYVFFQVNGYKTFNLPLIADYNFRFGQVSKTSTTVMGVQKDSPADKAEIKPGQAIIEIAGTTVYNISDIKRALADRAGLETKILIIDLRSPFEDFRTLSLIPTADQENHGILGVEIGESIKIDYSQNKAFSGFMHGYNALGYSGFVLKNLVRESFAQRTIAPVSASVSGPVGIFSVVGSILDYGGSVGDKSIQNRMILLSLIDLAALLSLSLALINILPFPALDGGRLVFIVVEKIRGKKISPAFEITIHKIGMVILLLLIVLVTIRDVSRII